MCVRSLLTGIIICLATPPGALAQSPAKPADSASHTTSTRTQLTVSEKLKTRKAGMDVQHLQENIDREMAKAIADGDIPGGVILVNRFNQFGSPMTVFEKAYGNRSVEPTTETATLDTIYDLASLTKSISAATAIMQLVEQGKIRLTDSVSKYIPEWKNSETEEREAELRRNLSRAIDSGKIRRGAGMSVSADKKSRQLLADAYEAFPDLQSADTVGKDFNLLPRDRESITIRHLLTHTSGLPSYLRFYDKYPEHAHDKIIQDIAQVDLRGPVGGQFIYSDLGFITLGDIVQRVSGMPLDEYAAKNIFEPLRMNDTGYNPPENKMDRIAPTEWAGSTRTESGSSSRTMIRGKVHDGNAYAQEGVSGHAGLFSTARDVGTFCDMLLDNGRIQGSTDHILSPVTIAKMTSDQAKLSPGEARRGLGWDLESAYDSEKGDIFETGFGHTGFTGTSIWVVPEEKLSIIVLTNRVHPDGKGGVVSLRARIANIVAGSITHHYTKDTSE